MIPALNEILFMLTALFVPNTIFVAQETQLNLNLELKTVTIEYRDLTTPSEVATLASDALNEIDKATSFHKNYPEIKLLSKSIKKEDGKLNARLTFSFDNQDQVLRLLRFNLTHHGKSTTSDALYYHLLPSEDVIISNGTATKQEEGTVLRWNKDSKEIQMELQQKESAKDFLGETISIADYWEK